MREEELNDFTLLIASQSFPIAYKLGCYSLASQMRKQDASKFMVKDDDPEMYFEFKFDEKWQIKVMDQDWKAYKDKNEFIENAFHICHEFCADDCQFCEWFWPVISFEIKGHGCNYHLKRHASDIKLKIHDLNKVVDWYIDFDFRLLKIPDNQLFASTLDESKEYSGENASRIVAIQKATLLFYRSYIYKNEFYIISDAFDPQYELSIKKQRYFGIFQNHTRLNEAIFTIEELNKILL
eukprot:NODE_582_length_5738_cov_0.811314.p3 type:complete len:238 gc:universal NODE_582_length_5738_cov_0.811314:1872-1159(-)